MKITNVTTRPFSNRAQTKPRVYFFPKGENVLENLERRHNRPSNEYRRLVPMVLLALGHAPDVKARWSQKAGCACGCSPGFVLDTWGTQDVFVDVEM